MPEHRPPTPEALLGRPATVTHGAPARRLVEGRRVMVTGAAGSIGSELVRQIRQLSPEVIIAVDIDEGRLHQLELELHGRGFAFDRSAVDTVPVIADVRHPASLDQTFRRLRPDIVFHAAALKHVALLEAFPEEGCLTNVFGTVNVVETATAHGAALVVNVSTDKAADPTSLLGATKRLAEHRIRSRPGAQTRTASVRFGNVLGSRGSFYDTLRWQITHDQPVTLTHPEVTRYFMTIPEAAGLVIAAATMAQCGEVYMLDMGEPVHMADLIDRYWHMAGVPEPRVDIVGLGPGEKLNEVLLSGSERSSATESQRISRVDPEPSTLGDAERLDAAIDEIIGAADRHDTQEVWRLLRAVTPTLIQVGATVESSEGVRI